MAKKGGARRLETVEETNKDSRDETTFKEAPLLYVKGFIMGSADIVPGVSGGTMALILDIYIRFLNAIKSVDGTLLKLFFTFKLKAAIEHVHLKFLVALMAGIFSAILFFTKVVPLQIYMFTHPEIVFGLFFGLIVGSIYILVKSLESLGWKEGGFLAIGTGIGLWIVNLVPANTPENPLFIFFSGVISISAMILPGISGSYILLILRKYDFILSQISKLGGVETIDALMTLIPFGLGVVVGLALFSRFLSWLLAKYYSQTISILIGFLIGSLFVIWPFQTREYVESIRETEILTMADERVKEIISNPNENLPEFERLGRQLTPNASFDEFKQVEVLTIRKKLIGSSPYIPGLAQGKDDVPIIPGILGMVVGLVLVGGLDFLRKKK